MPTEQWQEAAGFGIPQSDRGILTPTRKGFPIAGEHDSFDIIPMPGERLPGGAARGIPHAECVVVTATDKRLAIRRKCECFHCIRMALKGPEVFAGSDTLQLDRVV